MLDWLSDTYHFLVHYISLLYVPVVFGFILMTTICRALIFWQIQRTTRVFCFLMVFASLCFLYLVASLKMGIFWTNTGRAIFFFALVGGTWAEWAELIIYFHQKNLQNLTVIEAIKPTIDYEPDILKSFTLEKDIDALSVTIRAQEPTGKQE